MKRIIKFKYRILVLTIEITTLILIALLTYNFLSIPQKKSTFFLPSSDISTLLKTLNTNGYKTYTLDNILVYFITLPQKGWYHLDGSSEGRFSFFNTLHQKKTKTMQVVVFAGETRMELTRRLANDMKLDQTKLLNAYQNRTLFKEADILSGRYILARSADENTTIDYLFDISNKVFKKFSRTYCNQIPDMLELNVLLIMASIIQKESNNVEEMPLISSVIYNRLEKGMRLQMDGTLNYGEYAHTIVTPERIKSDESYYNTYKHKGLPPAPLGTISIEALKAAYRPKESNYLFFMLQKDGTHSFAHTYKEHINNIRIFREASKEGNTTLDMNLTHTEKLPIKSTTKNKKILNN